MVQIWLCLINKIDKHFGTTDVLVAFEYSALISKMKNPCPLVIGRY